jgi:hypothetical protein
MSEGAHAVTANLDGLKAEISRWSLQSDTNVSATGNIYNNFYIYIINIIKIIDIISLSITIV